MRNKQQNMGSQQAVDSSNYLPRTVCMEIPRQVSWLMEVNKNSFPKTNIASVFSGLCFYFFQLQLRG